MSPWGVKPLADRWLEVRASCQSEGEGLIAALKKAVFEGMAVSVSAAGVLPVNTWGWPWFACAWGIGVTDSDSETRVSRGLTWPKQSALRREFSVSPRL